MKRLIAAFLVSTFAFSFAAFAADEKPAAEKAEKKADKKKMKKEKKEEKKEEMKKDEGAAPKAE